MKLQNLYTEINKFDILSIALGLEVKTLSVILLTALSSPSSLPAP